MTPSIRQMTHADLPHAIALCEQAGWNQTPDDLRRFLRLAPGGCFAAEQSGQAVATVTTCQFESVGWIGMLLVEKDLRGRGIGSKMLSHAIDYLEASGAESVRLDATPLGQPIYERCGFAAQFPLARFGGVVRGQSGEAFNVETPVDHDFLDIAKLDKEAVGVDRTNLLQEIAGPETDTVFIARRDRAVLGYCAWRGGRLATFVGPCVARSQSAGAHLLNEAFRRLDGQKVMIDVPLDNADAMSVVSAAGLTEQRPFMRMCRGESSCEDVGLLWASSGPEKG